MRRVRRDEYLFVGDCYQFRFSKFGYSENDIVTSCGYLSIIRQINSIQFLSTSEAALDVRGQ